MNRVLGQEYATTAERVEFLKNNCDKIEELGYMRKFSADEIAQMKTELSTVAIKLNDIAEEKKAVTKEFSEQMKPLNVERVDLLKNIKHGSEFVEENCYKFFFEEERMVGYYNNDGELVSSRPALPEEMQKTTFSITRTGTND
jgi:hypothetical protein